jgi:hypothetical protein
MRLGLIINTFYHGEGDIWVRKAKS